MGPYVRMSVFFLEVRMGKKLYLKPRAHYLFKQTEL